MPSSILLAVGLELTGWALVAGQMAVIFAISTIASRIFAPSVPQVQDNGVRQQVPPDTTTGIPVVYGEAYLGGKFCDAVLSENQQVMWYTMAISCVSPDGLFTFDKTKFYYADKLITFDSTEPAKVISLTDGAGNVDTKIAGNLYIYLYRSTDSGVITNLDTGGSASGSGLPNTIISTANGAPSGQEWASSNRQMNGLAFAIVKLIYNRDAGTTSFQPITFHCSQTLNGTGVAKPGDVWYDYMTNQIYGCAVDPTFIDTSSVTALNAYSDQLITFNDYNGDPSTQPRYRLNGVLDTGQTALSNVDKIVTCCDSWMQYNAAKGQWSIVINKAESTSLTFNDTNIIGSLNVGAIDITQSINQIEAKFNDVTNRDQPNYVNEKTPDSLLYPNEPVNKYTISFDLVNDSVQALYLANRILEQAREDLTVTINTTYYGIQANAGDVISVTNSAYGWTNKLFRVMKVQEASMPDGSLGASLNLIEYNSQVYDDKDITQYTPAPNSGITSPGYFSTLTAPTIINQLPNAAVPTFDVECLLPTTGRVTTVTLYFTTVAIPSVTDWELLNIQTLANSQAFTNSSYVNFTNISFPTGTYYFAFKVGNEIGQTNLSPISSGYAWSPNPTSSAVSGTFLATFNPPTLQVPYLSGAPVFTGIAPQLYGTAAGGAIDYVNAGTDADTLFVNNTWRIGASSTTGLGDIVTTNITIGSPTDGGNYALFPTPTAMAGSPAYIQVPVRYKTSTGTIVQSITAICQLLFNYQGATGTPGTDGNKTAIVTLYQWSTTTPSTTSGTSLYTWATGTNNSYSGSGGWTTTVPANPGTPLIQLWTATKAITATASTVTTTVDWTTGVSIQAVSANGANGANGVRSARPTVYQWAATIPSGPTGTSTYTWSTNTFTPTPAGWSLTPGTSPSVGYTLWAAVVNLVDSSTVTTSSVNWTTSSISAVGYAGSNGYQSNKPTVYKWALSTPTVTGTSTYTWSTNSFTPTPTGWTTLPTALNVIAASCNVATTADIVLSGIQTIDGVLLVVGDRVLVKNQTTQANNGIYIVTSGSWTRATDADTWAELVDAFVYVVNGSTNGNKVWNCNVVSGGTLGTTAVTFVLAYTGQPTASSYVLYAATSNLATSSTNTTSTIDWSLATVGTYTFGSQQGFSSRICYSKTTLSSLSSTPTTITTSGNTSFPPNNSWGTGVNVRVASTANITTLSGLLTIDGIVTVAGDRVLVKNQTTQANNGIYVVSSGAWTRATDADTWAEFVGLFVFVTTGSTQANTGWDCTVATGGTLGVTAITFASSATVTPVWQATPPTIVAGESVYQSDGIFNPSTGNTVWNVPYLSNLKVGALSAITTNTGNLTVTGTIQAGTAAISGTTMTGAGSQINSTGSFALGNATTNATFDGTILTLNGNVVATNNVFANAITNVAAAYTAGSITVFSGTPILLQSVSITATGAPIILTTSFQWYAGIYGTYELTFEIRRNSTVLASSSTLTGSFSGTYVDTPTAGTVTYSLYGTNGAGSGSASQRAITLLQVKK